MDRHFKIPSKTLEESFTRNAALSSKLIQTFNQQPVPRQNKNQNEAGLFGIPELITPEGFSVMVETSSNQVNNLIEEALQVNRNRKIVEILDEMSDILCKAADVSEFVRLSHPDPLFASAAEKATAKIGVVVDVLNTNCKLYKALRASLTEGDCLPLSELDIHVTKMFLFDFERCGINLDKNVRNSIIKLKKGILQAGQEFSSQSSSPNPLDVGQLPENIQHIVIANGLLDWKDSDQLIIRELGYKMFLRPDFHQEVLLDYVLASRQELSVLSGFKNYSERVLKGSVVETPEFVKQFLDILKRELLVRANREYEIFKEMKVKDQSNEPLQCWDLAYYTSVTKKNCMNLSEKQYIPYFSLGMCMDGLSKLFTALYGIYLTACDVKSGEVWSDDVYKLAVMHESEGLLGHIYCDFYKRLSKSSSECHYTIQGGRLQSSGVYQNPVVVIMLCLSQPHWPVPALLSPSMVETLFHEMGHALHAMLARTRYQNITGTRCCTDLAEVPSVLMEFFAKDPNVVKLFARHYQNYDLLSDDVIRRICDTKNLFEASEMQLQLLYAIVDHTYHTNVPSTQTTTQVLEQLHRDYYGLPYVSNTAWQLRFGHLVGYGARYYSYLVSRAIALWIWKQFFERNPLDRQAGESFRQNWLAPGAGIPPRVLLRDCLQMECTPEILAMAIIDDLDDKSAIVEKTFDLFH